MASGTNKAVAWIRLEAPVVLGICVEPVADGIIVDDIVSFDIAVVGGAAVVVLF